MSFHNRQNNNVQCPTIKLHDQTISFTNNIKFLGLWMDDNLKWSTHIQSLVKRLSKICFALRIIQQIMHLEMVRSLYYAYFHSALIYGIIFWGGSPKSNQVFKIQKRAIRIMLRVGMSSSCRQLSLLLVSSFRNNSIKGINFFKTILKITNNIVFGKIIV